MFTKSVEVALCVYSTNGELIHRVNRNYDIDIKVMVGDGTSVFYAHEYYHAISRLDIRTGVVRENKEVVGKIVGWPSNLQFAASGGTLVFLHKSLVRSDTEGLYVFDCSSDEDYAQGQFFPGQYYSLLEARDDPETFVASSFDHIDVLKLRDGHLFCTVTFTMVSDAPRLRLVNDSRIYVETRGEVVVYSALNGERLRSMRSPPHVERISLSVLETNGIELLCVFF